jgi:hypothetical protein
MIQLELYQLNNLCMKFAELGAAHFVRLLSERKISIFQKSDMISQREAFALFGKDNITRWTLDGKIRAMRNGSARNAKKNYSYAELLSLDASESRDVRDVFLDFPLPQTSTKDLTRFIAADLFNDTEEVTVTQSERRVNPDNGVVEEYTVTAVIDGETYTATASNDGKCINDIVKKFRQAKAQREQSKLNKYTINQTITNN